MERREDLPGVQRTLSGCCAAAGPALQVRFSGLSDTRCASPGKRRRREFLQRSASDRRQRRNFGTVCKLLLDSRCGTSVS